MDEKELISDFMKISKCDRASEALLDYNDTSFQNYFKKKTQTIKDADTDDDDLSHLNDITVLINSDSLENPTLSELMSAHGPEDSPQKNWLYSREYKITSMVGDDDESYQIQFKWRTKPKQELKKFVRALDNTFTTLVFTNVHVQIFFGGIIKVFLLVRIYQDLSIDVIGVFYDSVDIEAKIEKLRIKTDICITTACCCEKKFYFKNLVSLTDLKTLVKNIYALILSLRTSIKLNGTTKQYFVAEAYDIITTKYVVQMLKYPALLKLFKAGGNNADDYSRIEKHLKSKIILDQIVAFKRDFMVDEEDEDALETFKLCLDFHLYLKAVILLASQRSLNNPHRSEILTKMINFFGKYTIDRANTGNELFLVETLVALRTLPIDVISVQASIGIPHALAVTLNVANVRSREEISEFLDYINGIELRDVNHVYLYMQNMRVAKAAST